ncbi:CatB-related O-acetyltransferase [Tateyamaria sp.]|uniref:CatB-related O-acetyltransferase n=1 Tax=Tateyamaria sp. TaxID=1929288 RepID=UPI00329D204F
MNIIFEEANNAIRRSQIFNLFVTQLRRRKKKGIARSSSILNSKIPGLASLGENSSLYNVTISGCVNIGGYCAISESVLSGEISIGNHTTINSKTRVISGDAGVSIGNFCSIAPDCYIQAYNHNIRCLSTFNMQKNIFSQPDGINKSREGSNSRDSVSKGKVVIGSDVWIGTKSIVLSGASIGDGVVIGANSLVNKSIPPYAIVGGSPAKILGFRFDEEIVDQLLHIRWWDWPLEKIMDSQECFSHPFDASKLKELERKAH